MKKFLRIAISLLVLFSIFSFSANAVDTADTAGDFWQEFIDILPDGADKFENADEVVSGVGVDTLISEIASAFSGTVGAAASFFVMLFGISVIISVAELSLFGEMANMARHISAGVCTVASLLIFGRIGPLYFSVKESIESLSAFFSSLIPIATGILSAGGNLSTASVQAFNMNLTLAAVSRLFSSLLLPLSSAMLAATLAGSLDGGAISSLARGIKGFFNWALGIACAVIIGAVSMQSVVAGAADSAYLRAAKYAASGMIPVVGSTVSGALSTLAGGLSYIKSTVGVYAVLVIVSMALAPLINLLLYRLCFSLCISFMELVGTTGGVRAFSAFRASVDALISVYAVSVIIYVAEVIVFMKCGVSVFG